MSQISAQYQLKRFKKSTERDYQSALLDIYQKNIEPDSRTNSNEISHWLDNYAKHYEDEFCLCGFYLESKIIGFTEFVYFRQKRIIVFDYMVLHKDFRNHGEFFQFAKLLQIWIDREHFEFDFVVAEVSFESANNIPSAKSISRVELFKMMGFKVADCLYSQPLLGLDNPESDKRAHLLIATREKVDCIRRETLLKIVSTITFDHYERWYKPLVSDVTLYSRLLTQKFKDFEKSLASNPEIELNGIKDCGGPGTVLTTPTVPEEHTRIMPAICIAGVIWTSCLGVLIIPLWLHVSQLFLFSAIAASTLVFTVSFVLIYPNRKPVLIALLNSFNKFFHKGK